MNQDESIVINFSDLRAKRAVMQQMQGMQGLWELRLRPRKRTRSLEANAYYFAAICTPFRDWLREQYGDALISTEQAHEMLKVKILGCNEKKVDGEVLKLIPRSKTLTRDEFSDFITKASQWVEEFCQIIVLPSEVYFEK